MTPEIQNALAFLEMVAAKAPVELDVHLKAKECIKVLLKALTPEPPVEIPPPNGPPVETKA